MTCPHCGSTNLSRGAKYIPEVYRKPRTYEGVIFRRHRCLSCHHLLTSVQQILTSIAAEDMEAKWLPPAPAVDVRTAEKFGDEYGG